MSISQSHARIARDLILGPDSYRPPAAGLEATLAGWWAEALGLDRVGAEDSFFELGGDSTAAEALFAAIQGEFALEMQSAVLLDAPTVATLAPVIHQALAADTAEPVSESLVLLRPGHGTAEALVLVPPRRPKELAYRRLVNRLAYPGPVLMLHHPQLATMRGVADAHLRALVDQGYGPRLHIVGECWGALLTLELVDRAGRLGLQPATVAVFDPPPLLRRSDRLRTRFGHLRPVVVMSLVADRLRGYGLRWRASDWRERATLVARKGRILAQRFVHPRLSEEWRDEVKRNLRAGQESNRSGRDALTLAALGYAPRAPQVPVHLLLTRDRGPGRFRDSREEWTRFLNAADRVHHVPGRHTGDAIWGHADALAAAMDGLLDEDRRG